MYNRWHGTREEGRRAGAPGGDGCTPSGDTIGNGVQIVARPNALQTHPPRGLSLYVRVTGEGIDSGLRCAPTLAYEPSSLSLQAPGGRTELHLLSDHRDNLVAERTRLVNQLHAQMLQIDPCYAEQSGTLTSRTGIRYWRRA